MKYSLDEKQTIIAEYNKSGLTTSEFCKDNKIGITTLNRWIGHRDPQFIKVNRSTISDTNQLQTITENRNEIRIEYKEFKIFANAMTDESLLCTILKSVVKSC